MFWQSSTEKVLGETSASQATNSSPLVSATAGNLSSELKPDGGTSAKVKPCCVCKDEKAARDECMLFSDGDAMESCKSTIDKYRDCMKGFGFSLP